MNNEEKIKLFNYMYGFCYPYASVDIASVKAWSSDVAYLRILSPNKKYSTIVTYELFKMFKCDKPFDIRMTIPEENGLQTNLFMTAFNEALRIIKKDPKEFITHPKLDIQIPTIIEAAIDGFRKALPDCPDLWDTDKTKSFIAVPSHNLINGDPKCVSIKIENSYTKTEYFKLMVDIILLNKHEYEFYKNITLDFTSIAKLMAFYETLLSRPNYESWNFNRDSVIDDAFENDYKNFYEKILADDLPPTSKMLVPY